MCAQQVARTRSQRKDVADMLSSITRSAGAEPAMFFAGVSVVLKDRRVAWTLLAIAGVLLVGSSVYVVSLPLA